MRNDVLIVHISTPANWRGGEQQAWYLIEYLHKKGYEQLVCCPLRSPLHKRCEQAGIDTLDLSTNSGWLYLQSYGLRRVFRHHSGKVLIHAHDARAHSLVFLMNFLPGPKYPLVVSRRVDVRPHDSRFTRKKYTSPHLKRILCVSKEIKRIMADYLGRESRLEVVYSGVDTQRFQKGASGKLHREYGLEDYCRLVGNTSAMADHKDYYTFLRVAGRVMETSMNVRFFIIGGDDGEESGLRHWAERNNLHEGVIFTGHRDDIAEILPELDVFLFTSKSEGLGTSVLDAMAAGVPVVATGAGGVPEMIEHEQTGLLADVGDDAQLAEQLMRMLVDDELRERVIGNGRELAGEFDKEKTAEKTLKIYREIVAKSHSL